MPDTIDLTTSDLAVLDHLSDNPQTISQREIARRSGLSVGMINAILKKLVRTGYVKTFSLNRRTIQYLLTPQGFAEKARKSYRYVLDTIRRYQNIHVRFTSLVQRFSAEGVTEFYLHGDGELVDLVAMLFNEAGCGTIRRGLPSESSAGAIVFSAAATPMRDVSFRVVDLICELNGVAAGGHDVPSRG